MPNSTGHSYSCVQWKTYSLKSLHYFLKFIYFGESAIRGWAEREGERENPKQALHCQYRTDVGLEPKNPEIMT